MEFTPRSIIANKVHGSRPSEVFFIENILIRLSKEKPFFVLGIDEMMPNVTSTTTRPEYELVFIKASEFDTVFFALEEAGYTLSEVAGVDEARIAFKVSV